MSIKIKLIVLFIVIKVFPVVLITYIAIEGAIKLNEYFSDNIENIHVNTKKVLKETANNAIDDSIKSLNRKSQENLEKASAQLASSIADFLYERDNDLIFLANSNPTKDILLNFYNAKTKTITIDSKYFYNKKTNTWEKQYNQKNIIKEKANNPDNKTEFHINKNPQIKQVKKNIYKEIVIFDLDGIEKIKVSTINNNKVDISKKENTFLKAEDYFKKIKSLKKGEIYVSEVIGEYIPSKIIGAYTKVKTQKLNMKFDPENSAYAGKENPLGKKFDGIIRFITPIYKNNKKIAYVSLALDHIHLMEYTDYYNPVSADTKLEIPDASSGNYAFMWDFKGRNISHPRDYFISGFDKNTGQRVPGWISKKVAQDFKESKQEDLNDFLKSYPTFLNQSLKNKPNIEQLKKGQLGLDCRYLNFAPQCEGWMQLTKNGGYGSFIIFWSKVWKLTTAATIPYYTGQYKNHKRGFGFVTIGANVNEFHKAANKTKDNLEIILEKQNELLEEDLKNNTNSINKFIDLLINELSVYTLIMVIIVIAIAIFLSNYISEKIQKLIIGTKEFSKNNLDYRIEISSNDEVGKLEMAFNEMAKNIQEEKKKIEQKDKIMFQQSKMAAMGEMIENIAHQWRQPLSMISSTTTSIILQKQLKLMNDEELDKGLKNINKNIDYLSNTIDDFKSFFNQNKKFTTFNINDTFEKTFDILKSKFKEERIVIIKEFENISAFGLENELIQVILNILNNSKDAFDMNNVNKKIIKVKTYSHNEYSVLEIVDSAKGIKQEIIDKIFEPYFTTKHQSQGTGIGLYMSHQIITKHMSGEISVENKSFNYENRTFQGACFTIKIPKSQGSI